MLDLYAGNFLISSKNENMHPHRSMCQIYSYPYHCLKKTMFLKYFTFVYIFHMSLLLNGYLPVEVFLVYDHALESPPRIQCT